MKNKDLIAILSKQDPESDVLIEYDTMCCIYEGFCIVKVDDPDPTTEDYRNESGIYLMCEDKHMVKHLFEDRGNKYEILHGVGR